MDRAEANTSALYYKLFGVVIMIYYELSKSGNVAYKIDEENRTIEASISCDVYIPQSMINDLILKYINACGFGFLESAWFFPGSFNINKSYTGKSKCHPEDVFDVEFGKKLALLRAKWKYQRAIEKKLELIAKWFSELNNKVDKLYMSQSRMLIDVCSELYQTEKETGLYD